MWTVSFWLVQVIPFLILAVGVDNLFIISQALDRQPTDAPLPARMGAALAAAGPSITLAAASEALAFGLAALTPMPAVRNFSLVAAVAVATDYALQVGVFLVQPASCFCTVCKRWTSPDATMPCSGLTPVTSMHYIRDAESRSHSYSVL